MWVVWNWQATNLFILIDRHKIGTGAETFRLNLFALTWTNQGNAMPHLLELLQYGIHTRSHAIDIWQPGFGHHHDMQTW